MCRPYGLIGQNSPVFDIHIHKSVSVIGAGNNTMVGATVAVAVSVEEAAKAGKF